MRRFFIDSLELSCDRPVITGEDFNHIKNVLRLKPDDIIELIDGTGAECHAVITGITSGRIHTSIIRRSVQEQAEAPRIIIAQALLKDNKADGILRQITELGVTEWIPYCAHRSIPVLDKRQSAKRKERWKKIAIEALKQCRRSRILKIADMITYREMLQYGASCDLKLIFWEEESVSKPLVFPCEKSGQVKSIIAVIGPEGGFTSEEIEEAVACGYVTASLGHRILKADTATLAVSALLQYGYGDMGTLSSNMP